MVNREHLRLLRQSVEAWNAWREQNEGIRPDLGGADLSGADLSRADLSRAILGGADLSRADLSRAILGGADLSGANLRDADLHGANLRRVNLGGANLRGAYLSHVLLYETVFSNTNLTAVVGLETCHHAGPSTLDHRTLAQSGSLPLAFLRGCGLPDVLIDYLPSLLNEPFQFYSCFISYASRDQTFAERLYADLQNKDQRAHLRRNIRFYVTLFPTISCMAMDK
jgi:uncharacterized protein YjbI with pentapeptide repeats